MCRRRRTMRRSKIDVKATADVSQLLLATPSMCKLFHDLHEDVAALSDISDVDILGSLMDTQLVAAYLCRYLLRSKFYTVLDWLEFTFRPPRDSSKSTCQRRISVPGDLSRSMRCPMSLPWSNRQWLDCDRFDDFFRRNSFFHRSKHQAMRQNPLSRRTIRAFHCFDSSSSSLWWPMVNHCLACTSRRRVSNQSTTNLERLWTTTVCTGRDLTHDGKRPRCFVNVQEGRHRLSDNLCPRALVAGNRAARIC
jgi:hypothetical protein